MRMPGESAFDVAQGWPGPGVMAGACLFEYQVASFCESWRLLFDQVARAGELSLRSSASVVSCFESYQLASTSSYLEQVLAAAPALNPMRLADESRAYAGTGGTSAGARGAGFVPAFYDNVAKRLYRSRFADGSPAPMHILDGLPNELVVTRDGDGRVTRVRDAVICGFEHEGQFYTREMAARELSGSARKVRSVR